MIDQTLVGQTAADLMDLLPAEADGAVTAVAIVVCVDDGEGVFYRTMCSTAVRHQKIGLFYVALDLEIDGDGDDGDET